ncbi:MAG: acyl-[ACP]--phospholipid O-acyltransferase [Pseudomonadota bacterium]
MMRLFSIAGFAAAVAVGFLNAFVDLGHKVLVQNAVFKAFEGPEQIMLTGIVNALILLPFLLLMSPAGFISDRYAKPKVMRRAALVAIAITLAITLCYYQGWFWISFALTFVLAAQSAIYGPAKLGYLKELVGAEELAGANGIMQAATTTAILVGMLSFSVGFEHLLSAETQGTGAIMKETASLGWFLVLGSILEYAFARRLPEHQGDARNLGFDRRSYLRGDYLKRNLSSVWTQPVMRLSVVGLAVFWSVMQVLIAVYPTFAETTLGLTNVAGIQFIMAAATIGIVVGSLLAAKLSRAYLETGYVPIGAAGVALCLAALPIAQQTVFQMGLFFGIGVFGSLFTVPLTALVQFHADDSDRGRILAASSFIRNLAMIAFLGLTVVFATQGLDALSLLVIITMVATVGAIYTVGKLPQSLVRLVIARVFATRYRLNVVDMEKVPSTGGVLLLGNHISWIDWAIVAMASPRPVRFVMIRSIYERWYLKWFLDFAGAIPIAPGSSKEAIEDIAQCLRDGEVVCLFPEGTISRHGQLNEFKRGFERSAELAAGSKAVIVPFYVRGLWGSQFSESGRLLKSRTVTGLRRDIVVAFGDALALDAQAVAVKQAVSELSISAWEQHVKQMDTLALAWLQTAKRQAGSNAIIESTGRRLTHSAFAAAVICFTRLIKGMNAEQNVGLLLPPSGGGAIANMATMLCGKTAVNLNYSASAGALNGAIEKAKLARIFTSKLFVKRLEDRGLDSVNALQGREVVYLEDLREGIKKWQLALAWLAFKLLPAYWIAWLFGGCYGAGKPAAILFSSGSEGTPKGVILTHRNIMANITQTTDMMNPVADDVIVGCLPLFHAFGLTVTTFLPLVEGLPVITHPDPTDVVNIAKAIYRDRGTVLLGTSTFLRFYVRNKRVAPLMLEPLRLVVSGAERLDPIVRDGFSKKFNKPIFEGYGATETTPVASVNVPDYLEQIGWQLRVGSREGSVGLPLPGTAFRIVNPDTYEKLPVGEDGLILIGGVQLMAGYLDDQQKTDAAIVTLDGKRWYSTGDKGHVDDDGFLTIVDRYSRFAKLGGEMVSLAAVEQALVSAIEEEDFEVVVVNIPSEKKGEQLVAIVPATHPACADPSGLRKRAQGAGLSSLMVPETWVSVDAMPKLGSGKTDFTQAKKIALETVA